MKELGFRRLPSDLNVYVNSKTGVFILAYVDDLMILGPKEAVDAIFKEMNKKFLIRKTGSLDEDGAEADFLGRKLRREGDSISFRMNSKYLDQFIEYFNLRNNKFFDSKTR